MLSHSKHKQHFRDPPYKPGALKPVGTRFMGRFLLIRGGTISSIYVLLALINHRRKTAVSHLFSRILKTQCLEQLDEEDWVCAFVCGAFNERPKPPRPELEKHRHRRNTWRRWISGHISEDERFAYSVGCN